MIAAVEAGHASAALPGEPRSLRKCSRGARLMGSWQLFGVYRRHGGRQWRPTPPAFGPMSAQGLAFTAPFVLVSATQFAPPSPRGLSDATYVEDFNAVKALGRRTGSTRTEDQTALAPFWEGNASVHWNQAANQMARANGLPMSASNRLLGSEHRDGRYCDHHLERKALLWRHCCRSHVAPGDGNLVGRHRRQSRYCGRSGVAAARQHTLTSGAPAGHPSQNGAAATVLLNRFRDRQVFTLTTTGLPSRTYSSISQARQDGNNARVWGGMHYPSTVAISDAEGEAIATYVNQNSMQRQKRR